MAENMDWFAGQIIVNDFEFVSQQLGVARILRFPPLSRHSGPVAIAHKKIDAPKVVDLGKGCIENGMVASERPPAACGQDGGAGRNDLPQAFLAMGNSLF